MTGLMMLATCRDDELTDQDPFLQTLKSLQDENDVSVTNIRLGSLSIGAISDLVVDKFPTLAGHDLASLSTVLHTHTKGNAFFTTQILQRLNKSGWKPPSERDEYNEGKKGDEEWDSVNERSMIDHLTALDCSVLVNVVVSDTANESPFMKEVMMAASCLGSDFVTSHLVAVTSESITYEDVNTALLSMEEKEFIRPRLGGEGWSWAHDKFQGAAYLLIDKNTERKLFHLNIGRRLLSSLSKEELDQYLFIVVSQFCLLLKKIKEDEIDEVAELLLQAGERSAQSSSFGKATSYIAMGTSLLKKDNWESQYELSVKLYNAAATMECCKGNYVEADKLVNVILRHTRTIQDRLRAIEIKVAYLAATEEHSQAMCLALDVLDQLGEKFTRKPRLPKVIYEVTTTRWLLRKHSVDDILNLQPMTDVKKLATLRILQAVFPSFMRSNQQLAPIVVCRSIKLTLKYGLTGEACYNFAILSMIFNHPLGYVEEAEKCANICRGIFEQSDVEDFMKPKVDFFLNGVWLAHKAPAKDVVTHLKKTSCSSLLIGEIDTAGLTLRMRSLSMLYCGTPLDVIVSTSNKNARNFRAWGQTVHESSEANLQQVLENLTNPNNSADPCVFTGKYINEVDWLEKANAANDELRSFPFWLYKVFVAMFLGEHEKAKEFMATVMKFDLGTAQGTGLFQLYFLNGLVDVVSARDKDPGGGGGSRKASKAKSSLKSLELYGKDVPANVSNKILLIEAELEVLKYGKCDSAVSKFKQSMEEARQYEVLHEEAYAHERYAIALLEWDDDITEALEYFERAKHLYEQWGSPVKVSRLVSYVKEKSGITMG